MLNPKLTVERTDNPDLFKLHIEPSPIFGATKKVIDINLDEVAALTAYANGVLLIQEAFPDWPADKRELLLTGMDNKEFDAHLGLEDDEE